MSAASSHGGYCGPAVKPIALHMVQQIAPTPKSACPSPASAASAPGATRPSSSLLGCGTVQVCTAAMHYGYRIVEDMIDGLEQLDGRERLPHHRGFPRPVRAHASPSGSTST
jgi:dihydropyrimidine dehydrogenase (NAD+) subunit PreA